MSGVYCAELSDGLSQEECLGALFDALKSDIPQDKLREMMEAVYLREDISSTYVGNGLAVPHGRVDDLGGTYIVFGVSKGGVDWPSEESKANIVALIGIDKSEVSKYLSILQKISRWKKQSAFWR